MPVEDSLTDDNIDEIVDSMAHEHAQAWEGDERLCWDSDMSDEEKEDYGVS